jgi:hypothetical protein
MTGCSEGKMEIHPAHGSIHSFRDFFVHLSMIVIGILIALSLEGVVEWVHHRHVAHEARVALAAEIGDNQRRTVESLPKLNASELQLQHIISLIHALQSNRKAETKDLGLDWTVIGIAETNWNSAVSTGAISYMGMPEVQRYTKIYALQHAFSAAQDRGFESAARVQGLGTLLDRDPTKLSDRELERAEESVGLALANTQIIEQLGRALTAEYVKMAEGQRSGLVMAASE